MTLSAIILWTAVIACGATTGIAMALYQWVLNTTIDAIWMHPMSVLSFYGMHSIVVLLMPSMLLGLSGSIGTLIPNGSASLFVTSVLNSLHIPPVQGLFSVTFISIIAIASGGSAGPEGPVLAIAGSIGPSLWPSHEKYETSDAKRVLFRSLTLGDMVLVAGCASIAAFFDDAISGCIFVMELPHMSGLQRANTLPMALMASLTAAAAHRTLMQPLGIAYSPTLASASCSSMELFIAAVPMGVLGGIMSYVFIWCRKTLDAVNLKQPLRGFIAGLIVGLIALMEPTTLMWGEGQMNIISRDPLIRGIRALVIGVTKFIAILVTTSSGYSAGIVFPLLMTGYSTGAFCGSILEDTLPSSLFGDGRASLGHCLGSAFLAGTMHTPFGTALLLQRMGGGDAIYTGMMILANYIAVSMNSLTLFGQSDASPVMRQKGFVHTKGAPRANILCM